MPRCFVTNCRSGYSAKDVKNEKVHFFHPPPQDLKNWMQAIPRYDMQLKLHSSVCHKHFHSDLIISEDKFIINGVETVLPRNRWTLKFGATPHIFPECPKYLSKLLPRNRIRKERIIEETKSKAEMSHDPSNQVHFEEHCFELDRADGRQLLRPDAIPTLFDVRKPPSSIKQKLHVEKGKPSNDPNNSDYIPNKMVIPKPRPSKLNAKAAEVIKRRKRCTKIQREQKRFKAGPERVWGISGGHLSDNLVLPIHGPSTSTVSTHRGQTEFFESVPSALTCSKRYQLQLLSSNSSHSEPVPGFISTGTGSTEESHDNSLLLILQDTSSIINFLHTIFGFLYRCTDFYIIETEVGGYGFPPGIAETILLNGFNQWKEGYEEEASKPSNRIPSDISTSEVDVEESHTESDEEEEHVDSDDDVVTDVWRTTMKEKSNDHVKDSSRIKKKSTEDVHTLSDDVSPTDMNLHSNVNSMMEIQNMRKAAGEQTTKKYVSTAKNNSNMKCRCQFCGKDFMRMSNLSLHISRNHESVEQKFECSFCEKMFAKESQLKSHELSHSEDGHTVEHIFKCDVCQKDFRKKSNFKKHMEVHSEVRQYICKVCGYAFKQKDSWKRHVISHTERKTFVCDICGKCFGFKSSVKSHMVVHSGERNFPCSICDKKFTTKSNYNRHMTDVHKSDNNNTHS